MLQQEYSDSEEEGLGMWISDEDYFVSFADCLIASSTEIDPINTLMEAKTYLDELEQFLCCMAD